MKTRFIKGYLLLSIIGLSIFASAADKETLKAYYSSIDGLKGQSLKTALFGIISNNTKDVGYDGLWAVYNKADVRPDGCYYDIYSNVTNFTQSDASGNYSKEGDMVNREHTVPQSWFSKASPMKSDAYQVLPTDGYVNNRRSNHPFGEVATVSYASANNYSKVGTCATTDYTGTVFEPNDEYKGDLARIYFYMATRYEDKISGWSGEVFGNGKYPGIVQWQLDMLLRWATSDPVSTKETNRNDAVESFQKNRNPYVDFPELEQYVWGSKTDVAFNLDSALNITSDELKTPTFAYSASTVSIEQGSTDYTLPTLTSTSDGAISYSSSNTSIATVATDGTVTVNTSTTGTATITASVEATSTYRAASASYQITIRAAGTGGDDNLGQAYYVLVTSAADLVVGDKYLIAYADKNVVMGGQSGSYRTSVDNATFSADKTTITSISADTREITLGGSTDAYTFYDATAQAYVYASGSKNSIASGENAATTASITVDSNGEADVVFSSANYKYLRYNAGAPRFACYNGSVSNTYKVQLYRKVTSAVSDITIDDDSEKEPVIYNLQGIRVTGPLQKGFYIINGKKTIIR